MTHAAFDDRVAAYAASPSHRSGESLRLTVEFAAAAPGQRALDLSTGTGFTGHALAREGVHVTYADLAGNMLRHALRHAPNRAVGALADSARLPFRSSSYHLVTCRHAVHHYADPAFTVREMARVLRPGGRLVIADTASPEPSELARVMHAIQVARDPSHVQNRTRSELHALLAGAGLAIERSAATGTVQDFDEWCARTRTHATVIEDLWIQFTASPAIRAAFQVHEASDRRRFVWPVVVIAAVTA